MSVCAHMCVHVRFLYICPYCRERWGTLSQSYEDCLFQTQNTGGQRFLIITVFEGHGNQVKFSTVGSWKVPNDKE